MHASGSSPFTWKIGAWIILATSVAYCELRAMLGRGREAELVVDDQVDRAADSVAGDVAHVEALGDDTLAGERGVAVHEDRQHRVRARTIDHVLARPRHAPDDGVDCFEVRRVCGELDLDVSARRAHELARRPEVVLDVA